MLSSDCRNSAGPRVITSHKPAESPPTVIVPYLCTVSSLLTVIKTIDTSHKTLYRDQQYYCNISSMMPHLLWRNKPKSDEEQFIVLNCGTEPKHQHTHVGMSPVLSLCRNIVLVLRFTRSSSPRIPITSGRYSFNEDQN